MNNMKNIRLCNVADKCILYSVEAVHMNQEGAVIVKKYSGFGIVRRENCVLRYTSGVPAAEKKLFWPQSPWDVFRLLIRGA